MIRLHPHQEDALNTVLARLAEGRASQLVCLPTGTGKTILALAIAQHFKRALFLVHRAELLEQTLSAYRAFGESPGVIWGDAHALGEHLTVGMVPTVHKRLPRLAPQCFDLVVIDEAHHAAATTWRTVAEHFQPRLRLGLSATPERLDGADLSNLFGEISYQLPLRAAVDAGLLVRPQTLTVYSKARLDSVHTLAGDFNERQLSTCVNTPERNTLIAQSYLKHARGRRALLFSAGIEHAQRLSATLASHGLRASWVSGADSARADKIAALRSGELEVLCNAMILTEGFDCPAVDAIVLARPTKSRALLAQMLGRGLRTATEKRDCLIIDVVDNTRRHSLVTAWAFFGHPTKARADTVSDPYAAAAAREAMLATAARRYRELTGQQAPLETLERWLDVLKKPPADEFAYGVYGWHLEPATDKQLALLAKLGYDTRDTDWSRGQASRVISQLPAAEWQLRQLHERGYNVLSAQWTYGQAGKVLSPPTRPRQPVT